MFSLLVLSFHAGIAQEPSNKVIGVVYDMHNRPVPGASLILTRSDDSSWKEYTIASEEGKFEFKQLNDGVYLLAVTHIGYKKYTSWSLTVGRELSKIVLPPIFLRPADSKTLKEAVVTTRKPLLEQRLDRTVVNVDAMISAAGSNALEVLSKSPGVTVSDAGGISLNGMTGVLVLIEDKPTYMSAQDLANYLRSLPGSVLDKIELMTNPPAKYDASGSSVINIRLKKNLTRGFNGAITAGYTQGVYGRTNNALNLNFRKEKFNLFGSLSYAYEKTYGDEDNRRYFYNADGSLNSTVLLGSVYTANTNAANARIGMDYFLSSRTTWGFVMTGNIRPKTDRLNYTSNQYDGSMKLDSVGIGYTNGNSKWKQGGLNLNFRHRIDSAGTEIATDIDYIRYAAHSTYISGNNIYLPDNTEAGSQDMEYQLPYDISIYSAKADYSHPIKNNGRVEAGIKSSYVNSDNATDYFDIEGSSITPDYANTNHFLYHENINAAYVSANRDWRQWSAKAGVRVENTEVAGHQLGNGVVPDSSFKKSYTDLFPTAYLQRKLDGKGDHSLVLSYGRRILRPHYRDLNPFLFYHDRYSYTAGNPYLSASYDNHVELSYRHKQLLTVTLSYDHIGDIIIKTTEAEGNILITRPGNLAGADYTALIVNFPLSPFKWWACNVNALAARIMNKGMVYGEELNSGSNTFKFNIFNQLKFNNVWNAELSGIYTGKSLQGQTEADAVYAISAGIQKSVLKNKGIIRVKMDDIFHTLTSHETTTDVKQVAVFHSNETDTRRVGLSFTYRFGKEFNTRKKSHNEGGADDEQQRVSN